MILLNYIPFQMGTSLKGKNLLPLWAVLYSMENHFYHIKWPLLNVTFFITHVGNLRNGCYANAEVKILRQWVSGWIKIKEVIFNGTNFKPKE